MNHCVKRKQIFEDTIKMNVLIVTEFPLKVEFHNEEAVEFGGVCRELFSAFWEKAYELLFEWSITLTPMIHPQMDITILPVIGKIISHGYLATGILPTKIALPTLTCMLLGPLVPDNFLLESFLDSISVSERQLLKEAFVYNKVVFLFI